MRILIVSGTFPPRKFGGVTASTYKLATSLQQLGHNVTVYTTDTGDDEKNRLDVKKYCNINGVDVYYFKNISNKLAFKYRIYLPLSLFKIILSNIKTNDIIAIQDFRSILTVFLCLYAFRTNTPFIIQARGSLTYDEGNFRFKKFFDNLIGKKILKGATKVIALSKTEEEQYVSNGVSKINIENIPNAIKISDFLTLPEKGEFYKKFNIHPSKKYILSLGRLNKIKGLDLLISSFSKVLDYNDDIILIIAGPDDGDLLRLKKLATEFKINSHVFFIGSLYGRDKISAYHDSNIFILPSKYEVFGNTVIEAMACGTPVIATTGCQISNVVRKAGLVVDHNSEQLSQAIIKLLDDDKLRNFLGSKGRDIAFNEYSEDIIMEKVENLYLKCCDFKKD